MECFSGGHLGLATFAILVLIVCTLLIMVVVVLGKVKVCVTYSTVVLYIRDRGGLDWLTQNTDKN